MDVNIYVTGDSAQQILGVLNQLMDALPAGSRVLDGDELRAADPDQPYDNWITVEVAGEARKPAAIDRVEQIATAIDPERTVIARFEESS